MKRSNLVLGIEGILLIILGLLALFFPEYSTITVMYFIGWLFLILGIGMFVYAIRLSSESSLKTPAIIESILLFVLGAFFVFGNPLVSTIIMIYTLIGWFIVTAIMGIIFASKWFSSGARIATYIINIIVIVIAIMALFDPMLAGSIFVLTLAYNFMFAGISRLLLTDFQ